MGNRLAGLFLSLLALALAAQDVIAGTGSREFRVNTYTVNQQRFPAIAALSDGGFVVTWESYGQDGDASGIFGQRFDPTGRRVRREFQVNTTTASYQDRSSVAALAGGGFVVVWHSFGQDGFAYGIYAQRYDAAGRRLGDEFRVNSRTRRSQAEPSVAGLADGGFIVTWESRGQDGSQFGIYGQRYGNDGAAAGAEFRVNAATQGEQDDSSVSALSGGGFVVTWTSRLQQHGPDSLPIIKGQRFDATGAPAGDEFQVDAASSASASSVAGLGDGGFVVVSQSSAGITGQRYDADGVPAGTMLDIAPVATAKLPSAPSVAKLIGGGFVVTWQSCCNGHSDDVFGRVFAADGAAVGAAFRVSRFVDGSQWLPAVAGLLGGGFVAVWWSDGRDGDGWGIYGRRFSAP